MIAKSICWREAWSVARGANLWGPKQAGALALYYLLSILTALCDGFGIVLLVNLLSGGHPMSSDQVLSFVLRLFGLEASDVATSRILFVVIYLLGVRALVGFAAEVLENFFHAWIRRRIQEHGLAAVLWGDWAILREMRVGQRVGALTEESVLAAKYFFLAIRAVYALCAFFVLAGVSLAVSFNLTALMFAIGLPCFALLQWLFGKQARTAARQMAERQSYVADIQDRLAGLFQIKVEGGAAHHFKLGTRHQKPWTLMEVWLGVWHASINAFNTFLPAVVLLVFYYWDSRQGHSFSETIVRIAGIGVIGSRIAAQLNGLIASLGGLSRLSASVIPVHQIFLIPQEPRRSFVDEALVGLEVQNVSYAYNGSNPACDNITFVVKKSKPLVIRGPSGSGKTTLANLLAGIYQPKKGHVFYKGISDKLYDSRDYRTRVGYVTQDIYLFHGSVRENLAPKNAQVSDFWLWECLDLVGAADFVRALGGLDGLIVESGRSLSGGEKRRLGIARAMVRKPEILIFDEITAGLDSENKQIVKEAVLRVARVGLVFIITHEDVFDGLECYRLEEPLLKQ